MITATSPTLSLRAGTLITQDRNRRILHDARIAVAGGIIVSISPWEDLPPGPQGETLDLSDCIVMPGLINTHTHAAMTVFRGKSDDLPLMEWLTGHIWPAEARLTPEMIGLGTSLACAEMLYNGTTTFCDLYIFTEHAARAVKACGMRAVLGEGVFDAPNASYASIQQAMDKVSRLEELLGQETLLRPWLVAHSVYATGHDTLARMGRMARDTGRTLTLHCAESRPETLVCLERFGKRPMDILRERDLLGPNVLLAHCVDITPEEIALLRDTGACVAHNPRSNMKLASGMAPVQAMRQAGVTVSLGTDGAASNNALNMFQEMGAAALMGKLQTGDPTALPAPAVLDMATREAAKAIGWPEIGSIAPGKQADLIALDAKAPNFQPLHNPVSHLAYAATGREVRLTMVAGRVLYQDGRFLSLDYGALMDQMRDVERWATSQRP